MYKVTSRWPHQDSIKVEWNLGKRCNYDCTYCPSEIHDNTSEHTDIEILKASVDKLMTLGKPIRLSFTGGEPTVHPKFEELINYCKHVGISWVSVTTNGTRRPNWYAKQRVDQWVFSIHFEYDWLRVLNTITTLTATTRLDRYVINVMAHHDFMPEVKIAAEKLKGYKIPYGIRRIRWTEGNHDLFDDMRYNLTDLEWIKSQESTVTPNVVLWVDGQDGQIQQHANDVIKLHLNKYKGWSCNAGQAPGG